MSFGVAATAVKVRAAPATVLVQIQNQRSSDFFNRNDVVSVATPSAFAPCSQWQHPRHHLFADKCFNSTTNTTPNTTISTHHTTPPLPPRYKAESATDACTYDYDGNVKNGLCECESADTAEACSSLGTSVGSQSDGGSSTCLVVDCGSKGLTFVPTIPTETTKLDLQNNPDLKELKGKNGDVAFKGQ